MNIRVMTEATKNAAEAYRRSRDVFDDDPGVEALCWPSKTGFVWIRRTPGQKAHLSGKEEERPKLYDFSVQRAKSDSSASMPADSEFNGVLKAWAEEYERLTPRTG